MYHVPLLCVPIVTPSCITCHPFTYHVALLHVSRGTPSRITWHSFTFHSSFQFLTYSYFIQSLVANYGDPWPLRCQAHLQGNLSFDMCRPISCVQISNKSSGMKSTGCECHIRNVRTAGLMASQSWKKYYQIQISTFKNRELRRRTTDYYHKHMPE